MKNDSEIRGDFRELGCFKGPIKPGTVTCDFYAEFMRRSGVGRSDTSYQLEWAGRFANGSNFQHADRKHQMIMLDIMVDGLGDGTARHVTPETMKEWYKQRFGGR